jgi:hypothetical protein
MNEESRIEDFVTHMPPSEVPSHLAGLCRTFEAFADEVWQKTHLQAAARVLPNMLRCISRQLRIMQASATLPVEVAAGACRTVFELNIRTRIMIADPDRMTQFWVERVFEEISLIEAFKRLSDSETKGETLKPLNDRIEELRNYASKWKVVKPPVESFFKLAEAAGVEEEYKAFYGFYSKYTHGTAWLVNAKDEERDGEGYRNIFLVQIQIYALDSHKRIEDFVRERSNA